MAPNANYGEIATTTIDSRTKQLADNVSKNNALLYRLQEKSKVRTFSGGEKILQELEYAENSTYKRYSGYETLDISPSDVFTSAQFGIKQAAVAVSISGLEELQNSGPERMIDLITSRVENAERTLENNIASDCYSDGTADSSKQIGGLQYLVSDAPTSGVVGGIDRATWSFWQNHQTTTGGTTSATIQGFMNTIYAAISRNRDHVDLILADDSKYTDFLGSLQAIQRIGESKMAEAGFTALKYIGADVVLDGGYGGGCPADHMYFLNTNYIFFRPHADRNFVRLPEDRFATNQDAMVKLIGFAGNMTMSNAFVQGVMQD